MRDALCVMALVLGAAPAAAQDIRASSQQLQVFGTASPACVLGVPAVGGASNASFSLSGASSAEIAIDQLVDPQSARSLASSIELSLPITCNASNTVTLRTTNGGLRRAGSTATAPSPGGFSEFLGYRVGLDWAGQSLDQASDAGGGAIASASPGRGSVTVRVSTAAGVGPLVAGRYADAIVIEFRAAN